MTLPEYITEHLSKSFKWGEHDCCLFTIGWVEEKRGIDYMSTTPRWHSAKEAMRIVKGMGGLVNMFDTHLPQVNPKAAQDGDVTVVGNTAYIFSGPHIVSVGFDGLVFIDRMEAKIAWKT